ncbi:hypothetical protein [Burkholderia ubonensis]|uniref:hypothetical protein n=1 Tax=Burkholderia ubonensis TaxID=101571 RepID=UPI0009B4CE02|nr:hypothetical protein [Burkholderia ubonensis]
MSASKAPAYFALLVAVAAGVLISGATRDTLTGVTPTPEIASVPAATVPQQTETTASKPVIWKSQTLTMASLRVKASLPMSAGYAKCVLPGPGEDEVGVCQPSRLGEGGPQWQIRTVTQRDRFVPATWFEQELQSLRGLPSEVVTRQLGDEANRVTQAAFTDAVLVAPADTPDAIAIQGTASGPPSLRSTNQQSCIYAFLLTGNRPTTLLYCTPTTDETLIGAKTVIAYLLRLNPSVEYKRGSVQSAEHASYVKRLRAAGGLAAAPDLVTSEQAYKEAEESGCESYPPISQERFQCFEGFAANRFGMH